MIHKSLAAGIASIAFGGSGSNRMMIIRPATDKSGVANITVSVKDADANVTTSSFKLTVLGQAPTITSPDSFFLLAIDSSILLRANESDS